MRILIDGRSVRTPAGRYVFHGLISGWRADRRVSAVAAALPRGFDTAEIPADVQPLPLRSTTWATHILMDLPRLADAYAADIVFCPNGLAPMDSRSVPYFQDMFHFRLAGANSMSKQVWRLALRAGWRAVSSTGCKLAVGVSNEIAKDVAARLNVPVVMIPNGIDVDDRRWTGECDQVFVMGGIGFRKDELTAIRAWARIPSAVRRDTVLVVAGVEPETRLIRARNLVASLGLANSVRCTGSLTRDEYLDLMTVSRACVSCSRLESFGLPVGEALAIGASVICSDIPAHQELVARAGAGITFEAGSARSLADELSAMLRGSEPTSRAPVPDDWSWAVRARQHIDAYLQYS